MLTHLALVHVPRALVVVREGDEVGDHAEQAVREQLLVRGHPHHHLSLEHSNVQEDLRGWGITCSWGSARLAESHWKSAAGDLHPHIPPPPTRARVWPGQRQGRPCCTRPSLQLRGQWVGGGWWHRSLGQGGHPDSSGSAVGGDKLPSARGAVSLGFCRTPSCAKTVRTLIANVQTGADATGRPIAAPAPWFQPAPRGLTPHSAPAAPACRGWWRGTAPGKGSASLSWGWGPPPSMEGFFSLATPVSKKESGQTRQRRFTSALRGRWLWTRGSNRHSSILGNGIIYQDKPSALPVCLSWMPVARNKSWPTPTFLGSLTPSQTSKGYEDRKR